MIFVVIQISEEIFTSIFLKFLEIHIAIHFSYINYHCRYGKLCTT